jgi:hypothetical protein
MWAASAIASSPTTQVTSMDQTSPPEFGPRTSVSPQSIGIKTGALATGQCVLVGLILLLVSSTLSCVDITVDGGPVATPPFPIENLLLDESAFPEGWTAYAPFEPEDGFGRRIAVTFSAPTCGGGIAPSRCIHREIFPGGA